ncbi:MAG: aminotransferase class III-fold pyridoxal phosphate-dependent enzyme [Bacteroidales bacterium]|nr:aminotransferase class III-fold pyridoxal phosphate-dependent enzyme [Bacteroidales bacterium]
MGKGQELYKKAKTLIPGGTMLLSKRPEMFLPEGWPSYYSKAKGCRVWDLDGREYIDCSIMGIGTNTLGYGREEVDEAVRKVITDGNMSTFNCPEEVELAERLIGMDAPWAEMARFARTGGEINAITVRIARAATGKDKIAICGYHGWHDWYLSVNLGENDALAGHLLPGLDTAGVPRGLRGSTIPFHYNDFEELLDIVNKNDIAAIKMEVCRNNGPENDFLQKIRQLCDERHIILIFDECTSGFRETFGGLHKKYGVTPDMAIYSKTMGNGYAISAVVGKRWIMEAANGKTFISSTFWTERIGPTAALAALDVMEKEKSWEKITAIGLENKRRWQELADRHGLRINQWGIPALAGYTFVSPNALAYKTYITQEMLKKGYLAGNSMYACICHTPEVLDGYFHELDKLFATIREFEDGRDVMKELEGPVCHSGFARLN